jgi:hypothetical protein
LRSQIKYRTFGFHAPTVIDDQADRNRNVYVGEILDLLKGSVFEYLEVLLAEKLDVTTKQRTTIRSTKSERQLC